MQRNLVLVVLCAALAGCATTPSNDDGRCTNLISGMGGLLKFCQDDNRVNVTESGIVGPVDKGDLTIVDDPETLASLTRDIGLRPDFKRSRKLIARACVVNGNTYASIRVSDLRRIMSSIRPPQTQDAM